MSKLMLRSAATDMPECRRQGLPFDPCWGASLELVSTGGSYRPEWSEGGEVVENSAPEDRSEWGENPQGLVEWAVGAETVAEAAEIWRCEEAQAAQWIEGWVGDLGWPEYLTAPEHTEEMWRWLRDAVRGCM